MHYTWMMIYLFMDCLNLLTTSVLKRLNLLKSCINLFSQVCIHTCKFKLTTLFLVLKANSYSVSQLKPWMVCTCMQLFPSFLVNRAGQDNTRQLTFSEEGNIIIKTRRNREQETGTGTGKKKEQGGFWIKKIKNFHSNIISIVSQIVRKGTNSYKSYL